MIASSVTYRGAPIDVDRGALGIPARLPRIAIQTISILMRQFEASALELIRTAGGTVLLIRPPLLEIGTFQLDLSNDRKKEAIATAHDHALNEIEEFRRQRGI